MQCVTALYGREQRKIEYRVRSVIIAMKIATVSCKAHAEAASFPNRLYGNFTVQVEVIVGNVELELAL